MNLTPPLPSALPPRLFPLIWSYYSPLLSCHRPKKLRMVTIATANQKPGRREFFGENNSAHPDYSGKGRDRGWRSSCCAQPRAELSYRHSGGRAIWEHPSRLARGTFWESCAWICSSVRTSHSVSWQLAESLRKRQEEKQRLAFCFLGTRVPPNEVKRRWQLEHPSCK